ncbi:hypothetical protein [Amycolatopsis echigonensis]|uniref:Uncharacterized protein n=1 Tax=Amycolatopsis echigonensis TaxID=2576905 RepID=A0A8E2B8V8_9PSEU|nr:hypothetical protein [Amycolatopsis echigonensis]MBB2505441.1 hypothetical protein [Amycolatopsis echigonensis]
MVTSGPDGASLELTLTHKGLLAGLVGLLTSGLTRRNVALEAAGLKARGEKLSGGDAAR